MFETLAEAGKIAADAYGQISAFDQEMIEAGYPLLFNATITVAFDMLSDCLRGTIDTMADLYEQPEYVLQAVENFYPGTLYGALAQAKMSPGKLVFIPLHKGLDGFMGNEQYLKFYWPTMKRLVGDHCCICGGFNDKLLISATPEQVKDEVKRVLNICVPGGGYMFDVNMTIDSDAKPENVEAMFDTVKTYGKY